MRVNEVAEYGTNTAPINPAREYLRRCVLRRSKRLTHKFSGIQDVIGIQGAL